MEAEVRRKTAKGVAPRDAAMEVVKEIFQKHNRIIFDGNNYSEEWRVEAGKRGLGNHRTTPDVLDVVSGSKKCKDVFSSLGVYTEREFDARNYVMYETYCNKINIECNTLLSMAR
jgi:glutamine synthetase